MGCISKAYCFVIALLCLAVPCLSSKAQPIWMFLQDQGRISTIPPYQDTAKVSELLQRAGDLRWIATDSAIELSKEAYAISKDAQYVEGAARALLAWGAYLFDKKDYHQSRSVFFKALPFVTSISSDNKILLVKLYNSLANIFAQSGNTDSAIQYYHTALRLFEKQHIKDTAQLMLLYANLGATLTHNKFISEGMPYLYSSVRLASLTRDTQCLAQNYANLGRGHRYQSTYDSSVYYYKKGLELYRTTKRMPKIVASLSEIGWTLGAAAKKSDEKHLFDQAEKYFDSAINLYPKEAYRDIGTQMGMGNIKLAKANYRAAIPYLLRVLDIYRQQGLVLAEKPVYLNLAECYYKTGSADSLYKYLMLYITIKDSLLNKERIQSVSRLEVKYRTAEKEKELAEQRLLLTLKDTELKIRNLVILVVSIGCLSLSGFLLNLYRNGKHSNRLQAEQLKTIREQEKNKLLLAQMEGVEQERSRLAHELHDGIGGLVAAVKMNFSILERQYEALKTSESYHDALALLNHMSDEVRKTAHNLMPGQLAHQSLESALRKYCDRVNATQPVLTVECQAYAMDIPMPDALKKAVFLIVQELVQNIVKHAQASRALIQLSMHHGKLQVMVEDNGIGLEESDKGAMGIGLGGLEDRIKQLKGICFIDSEPGAGITINMEFEINNEEMISPL